jgi:hypothetical protein
MKRRLALAATLHDATGALRADIRRALPLLRARYAHIAVSTSPPTAAAIKRQLEAAGIHAGTPAANRRGPLYRLCLRKALLPTIDAVHYLDFDRALHWCWSDPGEYDQVLRRARRGTDLLIGRTPKAHRTHHRPLYATEAVVNRLFAERLRWRIPVDFFVPSFVLDVDTVRTFVARSRALDATIYGEWAALLATLPGTRSYLECRGLDWETPDRDRAGVRRLGLAAWRARFETPDEWGMRVSMTAGFMRGFERVLRRADPAPPPRRAR